MKTQKMEAPHFILISKEKTCKHQPCFCKILLTEHVYKGREKLCPALTKVSVSNPVTVIRIPNELIVIILLISAGLFIRSVANMCKQRNVLPRGGNMNSKNV